MVSGKRILGSLINLAVAFIFFALGISRILLGYLPSSRRGHAAITIANNPGAFWITIGLLLCAGLLFLLFGVFSFISALRRR